MTKTSMAKPLGTKEAMIVAAEQRFALHGLEGASLRQIAIDSGQRNESAAHYHFGSREVCELHVANLVDMIAAGISVVPSRDTILKVEALNGAGRRD